MSKLKASLVKSALCLTTAKPRPCPTLFYFPGLTSQPWHDRKQFDWCQQLESNFSVIKQEYLDLQALHNVKSDYAINEKEHSLHKGQWDWFSYISQGKRQSSFAAHCPKTVEILEGIPNLMTGLPFAYSFFSSLQPQSAIAAHSAPCNVRLRCHFALIVPEGCGMRVGDEIRPWKEGECTVFDDSFNHEVWHDGTSGERVVLLFDVWHPDLAQGEIESVKDMFTRARENGWLKEESEN